MVVHFTQVFWHFLHFPKNTIWCQSCLLIIPFQCLNFQTYGWGVAFNGGYVRLLEIFLPKLFCFWWMWYVGFWQHSFSLQRHSTRGGSLSHVRYRLVCYNYRLRAYSCVFKNVATNLLWAAFKTVVIGCGPIVAFLKNAAIDPLWAAFSG